jgi:hypothetical protein
MDAWVWILIAAAAVVALALAAWAIARSRRTRALQESFGPEYDRTITDAPSRREAEAELLERQQRRDEFEIVPLSPTARERYLREWETTQARFVDDPANAVSEADELIQQVMRDRGYPVEDFERRAADLSVDHPQVVEDYRAAHTISRRNIRGEATTEDLRQSFVHYRSLFEDLLEAGERATT